MTPDHANPLYELRAVTRSFQAGEELVQALRNVDLCVARHTFVCIRGPSGSGKSTLLNLFGALDSPSRGTVLCDGVDLGVLSGRQRAAFRRRIVGFLLPELRLVPFMSARENVMLPALFDSESLAELGRSADQRLALVGCAPCVERRPAELSTGERQRVGLARALIRDPEILIADEPTANLDAGNVNRVGRLFRHLVETGKTVIAATHDDRLTGFADRVLRLDDGAIVADERRVAST